MEILAFESESLGREPERVGVLKLMLEAIGGTEVSGLIVTLPPLKSSDYDSIYRKTKLYEIISVIVSKKLLSLHIVRSGNLSL